ncbi:MAG TPA: radical SAM/SPASM domain-containing protein [Polyangiaceae bacterium]|nr:radical SAM/SPASM domain-containing protein [Polyangiaceae bacterium]
MVHTLVRPKTVNPNTVAPHPLRFEQVRIENTNRCGYKCFFCPRESLARKQGFMAVEDFELALERVGQHVGRVDLHGFGEPLLDSLLPRKLEIVRERWKGSVPVIYSTLGVRIDETMALGLVRHLSRLEVSFYGTNRESYRATHGVDRFELARANLARLAQLRRELKSSLEIVVRAFPKHESIKQPESSDIELTTFIEWTQTLGIQAIRERPLHNYGNGRSYNPAGTSKPCSVIWGLRYRILQITWNLDVIPCCFDFDAKMPFGNLRHQTLAEIFSGAEYAKFTRAHATNDLGGYPVCVSCEKCLEP